MSEECKFDDDGCYVHAKPGPPIGQPRGAPPTLCSHAADALRAKVEEADASVEELLGLAGMDKQRLEARDAQVGAMRAEIEELQGSIPHPGDGSCERCGFAPTLEVSLCEDCRDAALSGGREEEKP